MRLTFPERTERVLIGGMLIGIVLILQRYSLALFQTGLCILVLSTLLQIAVGNIPKLGSTGRSLIRIVILLGAIVAVFGLGVLLVPTLSQLGR